jgi:leucine dehydrogenase
MAAEPHTIPVAPPVAAREHEELVVRRGARSGLYTVVAVHSTALGPALGGCRMWHYPTATDAADDALRLSRAMTLKAAAAGLSLGGGKGVICLPPGAGAPEDSARRDVLLDFADTVDALDGAYITAEDVGTSARDMETIATATSHVTGLSRARGGSGDPSPWTALGVEAAIGVCCERVFGSPSLAGRTIAVAGLGNVGARVAAACARAGATLLVTDIDSRKRPLADEIGARWIAPGDALEAQVDVLVPCALGGLLDHDAVERLQAPIVAGAANNQLADDAVGALLAARDILWVPDFVANAGGVVNIAVELEPEGYAVERAETRVRAIADTVRTVLDHADATGATPLAAAMEIASRRVAEPASPAPA